MKKGKYTCIKYSGKWAKREEIKDCWNEKILKKSAKWAKSTKDDYAMEKEKIAKWVEKKGKRIVGMGKGEDQHSEQKRKKKWSLAQEAETSAE